MFFLKSITRRIVFLHVITISITSAFMPVALYLLLKSTAEDLLHRSLRENAGLIARYLSAEPDGGIVLRLPPDIAALFSEAYGRYAYSVADASGRVLYSSSKGGELVLSGDKHLPYPDYLEAKHGDVLLSGVSVPVKAGDGTVWVQVAQDLEHRDVLIDDIVREFFSRVGWITLPILLLLFIIDVSIFRRALGPLFKASEMAEKIGPESTDVRLPLEAMPSEIKPLVHTVNQALGRLERGFLVQRDFTADAAHELRTPLSILQARIDTISDRQVAKELSRDIARMKRIVSQLLDIAELEAFAVGPDETADLKAVCTDVAGFIAPLAVMEGKHILLDAPETPVRIHGNAEVLFRAVRNVAENALRYTPKGTAVTILVKNCGTVSLSDCGPGIAPAEQAQIFRRFWRKDRRGSTGAGLGLSIVKRIMDAHRGTITIRNLAPQGCVFILEFEQAGAASKSGASTNGHGRYEFAAATAQARFKSLETGHDPAMAISDPE
jgi:signal transduction histidine kinase